MIKEFLMIFLRKNWTTSINKHSLSLMKLKIHSNFLTISEKKKYLEERIKLKISDYLKDKGYSEQVVDELTYEKFINDNPSYYLFYPYFFNNYFKVHDNNILDLLSVAGFLYYKYAIMIDDILDDKNNQKDLRKFFIANICQEETIKILSSFFGIESPFWNIWSIRKHEHSKAYNMDKTLKDIQDFSEYEKFADYKSAFGKIAIDSLYCLSHKKDKKLYDLLLKSHKFFYVSFQIMDDISDYSEDTENGQFNISKYELFNVLRNEQNNFTLGEQKKLVYLKGVAEKLYIKAIAYCEKAYSVLNSCVNDTDLCLWEDEIISLHNTAVSHVLNIKGFINVFNTETKLYKNIIQNNHPDNAIIKACKYIKQKQDLRGNWNDILNDAGNSDIWATSYIIYMLSNLSLLPEATTKGKQYLVSEMKSKNLWGYNVQWIDDADSTSFALLSLKNNSLINDWLNFQNRDGGFRTYNNENALLSSLNSSKIQNVKGWMQSHFCVSAVAYQVFVKLGLTSKINFSKLREYLIEKLRSKEKTLSYWWTSDIYSIYHLLFAAVQEDDSEIIKLCEERVEKVVNNKTNNYFIISTLLGSLLLTDSLLQKHKRVSKSLVNQILSNQYTDGSWESGYSLKIPHPSIINSADKSIEWKRGSRGTNILVKDYNRLFTTVSCLNSLKAYEERIS